MDTDRFVCWLSSPGIELEKHNYMKLEEFNFQNERNETYGVIDNTITFFQHLRTFI